MFFIKYLSSLYKDGISYNELMQSVILGLESMETLIYQGESYQQEL